MKVLVASIFLIASGSFVCAQSAKTWDGFVTDTECGMTCRRPSAMTPDRACVRYCIKQGSKYGLWSGNHVYVLEPQSKASTFAGEKVRVVGDISNGVIQIRSIDRLPAASPRETQQ